MAGRGYPEGASSDRRIATVVTKNGKPVALLLSMADEDEIERMLMAYSPKLRRVLQTAEKQIRQGRAISHEEFWKEFAPSEP